MVGRESPFDSRGREAAPDVVVPEDVIVIVDVDKPVPEGLAEDEQHGRQQKHADGGRRAGVVLANVPFGSDFLSPIH